MVYDCIPFFNEIDILRLRLNTLSDIVDRFVIEEATHTFSGDRKELCFEAHRDEFKEFLDRITYIVVEDSPADVTTHERDYFQKNRLVEGLKDATADDIILFGDCDEIPRPSVLKEIIADFDKGKVYHLAQDNYYAFLNMMEVSGTLLSITGEFPEIPAEKRKWLGTKVCAIDSIPEEGIVRLRDLVKVTDERSVRVANGGWHFGYMGGKKETNALERIGHKVRSAAHQEYNDDEVLRLTMAHLTLGEDIFGRAARFDRVEVDETYPSYLLENMEDFAHLVMPEISAFDRLGAKWELTAGHFVRRVRRKIKRSLRQAQ